MRGLNKGEGYAGDFGTPEQEIPATGLPGVDWESCMTMNDTWGYKSFDHHWKSDTVLIRNLIDIASKGGNFLLNVGPTAEGVIPQASVIRLQKIGHWMQTNSEAIYGTTASPFDQPSWGRFTQKAGKIYAHVFEWPENKQLLVPPMTQTIVRAYLLADAAQESLAIRANQDGTIISLPAEAPDPIASVIVMQIND